MSAAVDRDANMPESAGKGEWKGKNEKGKNGKGKKGKGAEASRQGIPNRSKGRNGRSAHFVKDCDRSRSRARRYERRDQAV